jgi:GNAT superfamily N-acetyltransferase
MFTIETIDWKKIKYQYEKWRLYDVTGPAHVLKVDKVFIDIEDILSIPKSMGQCFDFNNDKAIAFFKDKEALACLKIQTFSNPSSLYPWPKIAGIKNFAVNQAYRNNGIGRRLMEIADLYFNLMKYDLVLLYSSQYASQYGFYEKFGYDKHEDVHLKYYNNINLGIRELNEIIKEIGKF